MQIRVTFQNLLLVNVVFLQVTIQALTSETLNFCNQAPSQFVTISEHFMLSQVPETFRSLIQDVTCDENDSLEAGIISDSENDTTTFSFFSTGTVVVPKRHYFNVGEYCITELTNETVKIKFCKVNCSTPYVCINKCCPPHQIVDFSSVSTSGSPECTTPSNGTRWSPVFYDSHEGCGVRTSTNSYKYHWNAVSEEALLDHFQFQPYKHIVVNGSDRLDGLRFRLMKDGSLLSQDVMGKWQTLKSSDFCIDGMTGYDGSGPYTGKFEDQLFLIGNSEEIEDFEDSEHEKNEIPKWLTTLYVSLMLIGSFFLLLTIVIFLLIWEKHNIHAWTIFAFVCSMFMMFIFLAVSHLTSSSGDYNLSGTNRCKSIGILAHFFYLFTMCWLFVINVDLWLTFRNIKPSPGRGKAVTRFALYAFFAFLVSFGIVAFAVSVESFHADFGDGSECEPPVPLPLYGVEKCYMQKESTWPYLYYPMTVLLTCNILTFYSTAFTLFRYRRQARNAISSATHQRESFVLFMKLFVVTGISWVLELISSKVSEPWWVWITFDSYNLLQAVLIFVIFALKKENFVFLYHKFPISRPIIAPIMRSPCCYTPNFDLEHTDFTGIPHYDNRLSRLTFRRGSSASTVGMMSSSSRGSGGRRDSDT